MIKLLLVEDNEINLDMIQRRLRKKFDIIVARTGLEAVEKAKSDSPQIILMDVGLPDIDGLEATRRIKADPATKRISVSQGIGTADGSRPHAGTFIEASTSKRPTIKQTKALVTSEAHGQPWARDSSHRVCM